MKRVRGDAQRDYEHRRKLRPDYWEICKARGVRKSARDLGIPSDLTRAYLTGLRGITIYCPILGIPLSYELADCDQPNYACLDKVHPDKGYIMDNVRIVSRQANILKQNNTEDTLTRILSYIRNER
jgi:hypothetical protein